MTALMNESRISFELSPSKTFLNAKSVFTGD